MRWEKMNQTQIKIHHILKDGTEVKDIKGHLIKADEFPVMYEVINRIQKKGGDVDVMCETL